MEEYILIKKSLLEDSIKELKTLNHSLDDCVNYSDEDCFYVGEISGKIEAFEEVLSKSKPITQPISLPFA